MPLTSVECGEECQVETQYSLNFVMKSLEMSDKGKDAGFENVLIVITFDGNVIKVDQTKDSEEFEEGRSLLIQSTPEKLSYSLKSCPILYNLCRGCSELGSFRQKITECFTDSVKCPNFSSQSIAGEITFIDKDGNQNGTMTVIFQVRKVEDDVMKEIFNAYSKEKKKQTKKKLKAKSGGEDFSEGEDEEDEDGVKRSYSSDSNRTLSCVDEITDDSDENPCVLPLFLQSHKTKCSGELFVQENTRGSTKIICHDCGGLASSENSLKKVQPLQRCRSSVRTCSECFENLSILPDNAPCPKCACKAQLYRKPVSFKSLETTVAEKQATRECLKELFEEIFFEERDRLEQNWQRLKGTKKCKKQKKTECNKKRKLKKKDCCEDDPPLEKCNKIKKTQAQFKRAMKTRGKNYEFINKNPGVILNHRDCQGNDQLVPKTMGWLWNVKNPGINKILKGWRPGAVPRKISNIIKKHYNQPVPVKEPVKKQNPTLRVEKKDGEYTVTMSPVIDFKQGSKCDLNKETTPVVFKISKTPERKKRSEAKKILKARGVEKKCDCRSVKDCKCLTDIEKCLLNCELKKVSIELSLQPDLDLRDLETSSDSEIDMDFTPPSALKKMNPCKRVKPVRVSIASTQYDNADTKNLGKCDQTEAKKEKKSTTETPTKPDNCPKTHVKR
ncbi:unnamed protein product [Diamesa tonsa]